MSFFETIRLKLGSLNALPILSVMGLICGILAGGVVILFRLFIESGFVVWHSGQGPHDFEGSPWWFRLCLPLAGGFLVGLVLHKVGKDLRQVGIGHILERMTYHQGYVPWRNAVVQFLMGGMTLATGQSVGREGPSIHLGSAAGSWLGQRMKLPNNSIRILVGCGTAAAISASFNTPLAGVIFAVEVVILEYTAASFIPLILASASAVTLSRIVFGDDVAFSVPSFNLVSLWEIPYLLLVGLVIGSVASFFIKTSQIIANQVKNWSIWLRCGIAGSFVGVIALGAPEVMGIGYDTVNAALHSRLAIELLAIVFIAKLAATVVCSSMSLPGGVIGPSLFIGAMLGGLLGALGGQVFPEYTSDYAFYAMIGMAAMMSAILQAPLAALLTLLELTNNPNILFPGMLALVISNLVVSQLFKQPSIFKSQMQIKGLNWEINPLSQFLRSVGVAGLMERKVAVLQKIISYQEAEKTLETAPRWILVKRDSTPVSLMAANDLAKYIVRLKEEQTLKQQEARAKGDDYKEEEKPDIDLLAIPASRSEIASVYLQATLEEALDSMDRESVDAVYIFRTITPTSERIYGVLTREVIESHYSYKR